jgi:GT2 family glycosyltransferase
VIIVAYFSSDSLGALLHSIEDHQDGADVRLVVVDNSCDADEFAKLAAICSAPDRRIVPRLVRAEGNLGYAGGNNRGFAERKGDESVVLICNPDLTVTGGSFSKAAREVLDYPNTVFGYSTLQDGAWNSGLAQLDRLTGKSTPIQQSYGDRVVAYPQGHFLALPAEIFGSLGGFSESYFLYCEEADLVLRGAGSLAIRASSALEVEHAGGATTGSQHSKSDLTRFHATRSRVILFARHTRLRPWLPALVLSRAAYAATLALRLRFKATGAVLRGIAAGLNHQYIRGRQA